MSYFGRINDFDDLRRAFYEMIRVARPGTSIMGDVEPEQLAMEGKRSGNPLASNFYQGRDKKIAPSERLLPAGMLNVKTEEIWNGKFYTLTFRTVEGPSPAA